MKRNKPSFYIALLVFALAVFMPKVVANSEAFAIEATATTSEILIERDSLRVLKASNEHIKRGIASTTKILTAITVIENCPLDKVVEIPKEAEGVEGSSIYLRAGEKLTVEELLYALMLRSGNDAAVALANATSGNVKSFASLMNRTAKACGAIESNFTNPHGLDDENHYSTAYDLALITAHALKNETFKKIADTERIEISNENYDYPRVLVNKNKLLYRGEEYDGVKTGYTKKCGRCLVASRTENGMQLIAVVLNLGPMFERCEELLVGGAKEYSFTKVLSAGEEYGRVSIRTPFNVSVPVTVEKDVYIPMTDEESKDFSVEIELGPQLKTDPKLKNISAKIKVFSAKDLIYSFTCSMIIQQ